MLPSWWDTLTITGHVEAGATFNANGTTGGNFGHLFTDKADILLLNWALLTIQRPLDQKAIRRTPRPRPQEGRLRHAGGSRPSTPGHRRLVAGTAARKITGEVRGCPAFLRLASSVVPFSVHTQSLGSSKTGGPSGLALSMNRNACRKQGKFNS